MTGDRDDDHDATADRDHDPATDRDGDADGRPDAAGDRDDRGLSNDHLEDPLVPGGVPADGDLDAVVYDAAEVVVGPADGAGDPPADRPGDRLPATDDLVRRHDRGAVAVVDGRIAAVGPTREVTRAYPPENATHAVDAAGRAVVPGFVDSHTHAVFAGDRADEFEAKVRGKSYEEIAAEGGGILRTVRATRSADRGELLDGLLDHLDGMLAHGTTTVEVKSGYGLDTETELELLDAIAEADRRHPVDLRATFMGAHAVPEDETAEAYVDRVVDEQIPAAADQGIATFCDVFCEAGAFTVEQSRRVLRAGMDAGLTPKVHAEELSHLGGAQLAAEVGAASADHLLHATDEDARALASADVTPVLLPGTAFALGAEYADARQFLDLPPHSGEGTGAAAEDDGDATGDDRDDRDPAGWNDPSRAPMALATDFNPNCFSRSVPFAVSLACVEMETTPAEALLAATRGGAAALDLPEDRGTIREGAPADLVVLSGPSHVHLPYAFGENPVETVIKGGEVVHDDAD